MELIILSGIQCAGKSTFYQNRFSSTHARLNLDTLLTRKKELAEFSRLINENIPVVVDNTNQKIIDRAKYIEGAKLKGYRIIGYQFNTPLSIAMTRCSKRKRQKVVPTFVIKATLNNMEPLTPSEGFDEIFQVDTNGEVFCY